MANNTSDKNTANKNSGLPLVIIGVVLLVAIIGGFALYKSSGSKTSNNNVNRPANNGAKTPQTNATPLISNDLGAQPPHFKGAQNSAVVVEEFADYQCPTCGSMHPVMNEINATYGSRIKFIYRNYPLTQIHKNAYEAATSAEAAGLQGKFWEMQALLFQNQRTWSNVADVKPIFEGYAQTIGLDVEKFKADVLGMNAKQRVDLDLRRAQSLNLSSTPSILVNGVSIPYEQMTIEGIKKIIDAELAKTGGNQPTTTAPANKTAEEQGAEKPAANANK